MYGAVADCSKGELSTREIAGNDSPFISLPLRDVDTLTERDDADELAAYGWGVPRAMTKRDEELNRGECGGCGLEPGEKVERDDADELAAYGWGVPRRTKRDDADELAAYGWGVPRERAKRDDADELAAYGWGVPKEKSKRDDADELAAYGWGVPR